MPVYKVVDRDEELVIPAAEAIERWKSDPYDVVVAYRISSGDLAILCRSGSSFGFCYLTVLLLVARGHPRSLLSDEIKFKCMTPLDSVRLALKDGSRQLIMADSLGELLHNLPSLDSLTKVSDC